MIDGASRLLLFLKDFTGRGGDSYFWCDGEAVEKTNALQVVSFEGAVICHDFWMMRDALFDSAGRLPNVVIDLDEFRISISGDPEDRLTREKHDITTLLERHGVELEVASAYSRMFNKGIPFDPKIAVKAAAGLLRMYDHLCERAREDGEADRFFSIEVPIYHHLQAAMAAGIVINANRLSEMRADAEHNYFSTLKEYSEKHNMPLQTPSRRQLEERLASEAFELDDVSVEYLLEYVPHERDFGADTNALIEADEARRVLGSLTLATSRLRPVLDVFGSRTSRIHLRSPSLQNIPKKYRGIIAANKGAELSYVDFDQYEVGIMAALSGDPELLKLYAAGDMYDLFAATHLGLVGKRKAAKQLFLSYAYGMSRKALIDAAVTLGVDRQKAKAAFRLFEKYEAWKKSIWADFQESGQIATLFGNHYRRTTKGQLTAKEQRSAVSQIVQGTASLIFKLALLEVIRLDDVKIVLPMHDAVLFEHRSPDTPVKVVAAFERAMTEALGNKVRGKASIGAFVGV